MMDDEITECPLDSTQEEGACRSSSASSCPRPAGRKTPARPADSFAPGDGRGPRGPLMSGSGPPGHKPPRRSTVHVLGLAPPRLKDQSQGARAHNRPSHRSAVRPFFCCGSELSLVSLMDSVDLNGPSHGAGGRALVRDDKHSLSDSEDAAAVDFLPHGGYSCHSCQGEDCCGDDYGAACGSGASIQTVCGLGKAGGGSLVRRVKSDKRKPKKHFWSLRFGKKGPAAAAAAGGAPGGGAGAGAGAVKLSEVRKSVCGQCGSKKCHASQQGARCQKGGACGCRQAYRCLGAERRAGGGDRRASVAGVFPISGTDELLAGERSLDRTATRGRASCDMSSFMDHIRETPLSQLASRLHRLNPGTSLAELTPGRDPFEEYSPLMELHGADFVSEDLVEALVHTRVDFVHHLVPDLNTITGCSFYWGVMDRYEAERLLDQRREGTFLLRDSAQDDFLFSVSFRRYNRSLHARIEQWNHRFSFDIHDPAVYSADSVCGLIEHYKDSSRCMFFEPMLTEPLHRSFPFSLQHLARAVVCNRLGRYDHIARLPLPTSMKAYLRYYHYKQKVCVRSFEDPSL